MSIKQVPQITSTDQLSGVFKNADQPEQQYVPPSVEAIELFMKHLSNIQNSDIRACFVLLFEMKVNKELK